MLVGVLVVGIVFLVVGFWWVVDRVWGKVGVVVLVLKGCGVVSVLWCLVEELFGVVVGYLVLVE